MKETRKKPGPKKGSKSNNPAGAALGSKRKIWTKDGHAELIKQGFNPVAEMVKLYVDLSEDLENEKFSSHVWQSSIRGTQKDILNALLPYSVHKVEVSREKEIQDLKRPPVIINLPESAKELGEAIDEGTKKLDEENKDS